MDDCWGRGAWRWNRFPICFTQAKAQIWLETCSTEEAKAQVGNLFHRGNNGTFAVFSLSERPGFP